MGNIQQSKILVGLSHLLATRVLVQLVNECKLSLFNLSMQVYGFITLEEITCIVIYKNIAHSR